MTVCTQPYLQYNHTGGGLDAKGSLPSNDNSHTAVQLPDAGGGVNVMNVTLTWP